MKNNHLLPSLLAFVALGGCPPESRAALSLGSAQNFAVLGASTVTSTGNTVLNGNLGLYAGASITGFLPVDGGPGIVNATVHIADAVAQQAQADALTAYNNLAALPANQNLTGDDLGGRTLTPGVYSFNTSAQLTGTLTLSGSGDFVFLIGSTLTTASSSSVLLINGANAGQVFWQVGSSATLGATTAFDGSILANQSITMNAGASLVGGAYALNAAVTLDDNLITAVPEPSSFWPAAWGTLGLVAWQLSASWRRRTGR